MLYGISFVTSLTISLWGLVMIFLGIVNGVFLWVALGFAVLAVGLPILASHPWAASRLYPVRGGIGPPGSA